MDKSLAKNLSFFRNLDLTACDNYEDPVYFTGNSQLDDILNEIFSVDPVSGLPKGDIQYYMSADGNPIVKQWLESHLLMPSSGSSDSKDISDDMIYEFSRKSDESLDDYVSRIASLRDAAIADYQKSLEVSQSE